MLDYGSAPLCSPHTTHLRCDLTMISNSRFFSRYGTSTNRNGPPDSNAHATAHFQCTRTTTTRSSCSSPTHTTDESLPKIHTSITLRSTSYCHRQQGSAVHSTSNIATYNLHAENGAAGAREKPGCCTTTGFTFVRRLPLPRPPFPISFASPPSPLRPNGHCRPHRAVQTPHGTVVCRRR